MDGNRRGERNDGHTEMTRRAGWGRDRDRERWRRHSQNGQKSCGNDMNVLPNDYTHCVLVNISLKF
jgi:hypothetical protein